MRHKIVLEIEDYTPDYVYEDIDKKLVLKDITRWVKERTRGFTRVKIKSIKEV